MFVAFRPKRSGPAAWAFILACHLAAAFATLLDSTVGGCALSLPALVAVTTAGMWGARLVGPSVLGV